MGKPRGGRPSLVQSLDREVYQVVRKFVEEQDALQHGRAALSVPTIYDYVKRSNSSMARRSKKLLEDSIERVLDVIQWDQEDGNDMDSLEGDFGEPEGSNSKSANGMNQNIVGGWAKSSRSTPSAAQSEAKEADGEPRKVKRRAQNGEPTPKRRKAVAEVDHSPPEHVKLDDLGGVDGIIQKLTDLVVLPLLRPDVFSTSKIQPPRGILLHGPPGCGKTMIANAFAAELKVPFISIPAPSIVSGMSGESEKALREHFEEAKRMAPCLVFIDEIDAITPKRESAQREMEKRIVAQLLTCMDDLALEKTGGKAIIVLAATNRPDSLDPALRRGGRFDKEINMTVPSEPVREQILRALTREMTLADDIDFRSLAKMTPGFVGADLSDLVSTAGAAAIHRLLDTVKSEATAMEDESDPAASQKLRELRQLIKFANEPPSGSLTGALITSDDFMTALPQIQPSAKREGFATIPETTWANIGALQKVREELTTAIVEPIRHPEKYARVGITAPTGVLLWGPPGCGKTLLAKAVANESRANFISIKGPELLNKYVGESERAVRQVFMRARSSVPCVIFFDELDALVPKRDDALSESSARVVNTLLTELDGLSSRNEIYVIGATNRPDIIDPAMLRPGRLETLLFVDLPGPEERVEILQTLVRNLDIQGFDGLDAIARECDGFSGADLGSLVRRAGYEAIRRDDVLLEQDFVAAQKTVKPSVVDQKRYTRLQALWSHPT